MTISLVKTSCLSLLIASSALAHANGALTCVNSSNIFEQQICKELSSDIFVGEPKLEVMLDQEDIGHLTDGFLEGEIDSSGCNQLKGRGGYRNVKTRKSVEFLIDTEEQNGALAQIRGFEFATDVFIFQGLKERNGFKKPIVGGCTYTNWDNFHAEASANNVHAKGIIVYDPNVTSVVVEGEEYVINFNPKIEIIGGFLDDVDLSFDIKNRDRNFFEQIALDVLNGFSMAIDLPEAFITGDEDFVDGIWNFGTLNDQGIYNYTGISPKEIGIQTAISAAQSFINNNKHVAGMLLLNKEYDLQQQLDDMVGNHTDGISKRYLMSEIKGKAMAPIMAAMLPILL